ncbi:MAG: exonuclease domain-containing protein [Chloroflexota bacterium]|nr:exonuclease domain-containing protein [Chloroflexota bacterium]
MADDETVNSQQENGTESVADDQYAWLRQRTFVYLREQGGAAHEDAVIRHVFGSGGPPALWRTLMRTVLDEPATFRLRPDLHWSLVEEIAVPTTVGDLAGIGEYIVLDVETTGLRPFKQRLIEVCALKIREGTVIDVFTSLLNPEKRLPGFIVELTGITDEMVQHAPRFAAVADSLVRFIGERLVIGHNVRFDISFVNAELSRIGKPPLVNPRLDTLSLAVRLLPGLKKPNLERMATTLGVPITHRHRAEGDARLTAEALHRLLPLAKQAGLPTLEAMQALSVPATAEPHGNASGVEAVGSGKAYLDRAWLRTVPHAPGIYRMQDEDGRVIYIGKAKNLHDRVSSYYSQHLGLTRKMDGLLESVARIEIEVVGSELEALLLESRMIHHHQPRYNRAMKNHALYPYIKIEVQKPWPRIRLARTLKEDGARYFGPFRSRSAAERTVNVLAEVLPLVTCTRGFSNPKTWGNPCPRLGMGKCLGPCVGQGDPAEYFTFIDDAMAFLEGRSDGIRNRLQAKLETAAERLDFEDAARLRDALRTITSVASIHQTLARQVETGNLVLALPSAETGHSEALLVVHGRIAAQRRVKFGEPVAFVAEWLMAAYRRAAESPLPQPLPRKRERGAVPDSEDAEETSKRPKEGTPLHRNGSVREGPGVRAFAVPQDDVDELHIIERWLHHHAEEPGQFPLPDERDAASGWWALAESLVAYDAAAEDWSKADLDAVLLEEDDESLPPVEE